MTWNWLQPDWPDFTWNRDRLAAAEKEFVLGSGVFLGAIKHLGDADRNQLTVEAMSTEALTTGSLRSSRSLQRYWPGARATTTRWRTRTRPMKSRHGLRGLRGQRLKRSEERMR
jgi:hypothetical protein